MTTHTHRLAAIIIAISSLFAFLTVVHLIIAITIRVDGKPCAEVVVRTLVKTECYMETQQ